MAPNFPSPTSVMPKVPMHTDPCRAWLARQPQPQSRCTQLIGHGTALHYTAAVPFYLQFLPSPTANTPPLPPLVKLNNL